MKNGSILILFLLCIKFSIAQNYEREFKPFKFVLSGGYGKPTGSEIKGGAVFSAEPTYALLSDALSFGIRLEGVMLKTGETNIEIDSGFIDASSGSNTLLSGVVTCDYYFNTSNVRPFIGGGGGLYIWETIANKEEAALLPEYKQVQRPGFLLRGGIEIGHFRTGIEYNLISTETMNKYFSIKVGVVLGGGRFGIISENN